MSRGTRTKVRCVETGVVFDSLTELAAYIGSTCQAVSRECGTGTRLKGYHYERVDQTRSPTRRQLDERNGKMRKDRESGMSIREIAERYGLSYQGAWRILN